MINIVQESKVLGFLHFSIRITKKCLWFSVINSYTRWNIYYRAIYQIKITELLIMHELS